MTISPKDTFDNIKMTQPCRTAHRLRSSHEWNQQRRWIYFNVVLPSTKPICICLLVTLLFNIVAIGIIFWDNDEVVRAVWVDFDAAELAGRNTVLEEDIEIGVGETLWFCNKSVRMCKVKKGEGNIPGRRK